MGTLVLVFRILSHLAPVPLLILGWRRRRLLALYGLAGLLSDLLMLALTSSGYHMAVANLFLATEFVMLSLYFSRMLRAPGQFSIIIFIVPVLFAVHTFSASFTELNLLGASVLCILYVGYALAGYYRVLQAAPVPHTETRELFWASTALLFYAAGVCLFFLFYASALSTSPAAPLFWIAFFLIANTAKYVFLFTALLRNGVYIWKRSA